MKIFESKTNKRFIEIFGNGFIEILEKFRILKSYRRSENGKFKI